MSDKKENENNENVDIEIVIGDDSNLKFSDAKDCINNLRPKNKKELKDKVIVPKNKNSK